MATSSNPAFEWFRRELAQIQSRRFHLFEPVAADELRYRHAGADVELTGPYADFLFEFGLARLFTDHRDAPVVSVYPLKEFRRHDCADGTHFIGFGFRGQQSVWFDEAAILSTGQSAVFTVNKQAGKLLCEAFDEWLHQACDWARAKYSATQWKKIVAGPPPFTPEQLAIVEARKAFEWKLAGFADNGDALFEVSNRSSRSLPWLTLGIRDKSRKVLDGAVWLDVGHIGPGETAVVARDAYKDQIASNELQPYDLPDPIPEKRDRYWEFGPPP